MVVEARVWGDGGGDVRSHVIETISIARGLIGCRCGTAVVARYGSLDEAWTAHGGKVFVSTEAGEATDEEVQEFLTAIGPHDDAEVPHSVRRYSDRSGIETVVSHTAAVEEGFEWLERVKEMRARCTCATTHVMACPNYVEGDEE